MPNIEQDLQAIMDARYGREVRQSIHDAIRDINNVADNAESVAITSQESAQNNATKAESYAVGGTGTRTGEDTDNAEYYKNEAERLAGVYAVEDNLTSTSTIHSLSANQGRILNEKIGAPNGVASLDANGRVPSTQLPSYVDDVLEYASVSNFPATGESGKIYIALDTNKTYRWSGSAYVEISESLALGETSSTAYAGDKGKRNADDIDAIQEVIPSNASTSNKLATMADVGGGGHVLQNQSGTDMTQQPNMQFVDAQLANDATNERTTVEIVKEISAQELQSAPDGLYLIPDDGSGAVCDAEDVSFDNTGTDLTATNTEAAIKEVNTKVSPLLIDEAITANLLYTGSFDGRRKGDLCQIEFYANAIPTGVWTTIGTLTNNLPLFKTMVTTSDSTDSHVVRAVIQTNGNIDVYHHAGGNITLASTTIAYIRA